MLCKKGIDENNSNGAAKQEDDDEEDEEDETKNSSAENILRDFNYKLRCMISERSRKLKATLRLLIMFFVCLFLIFMGELPRGQELTKRGKTTLDKYKYKSNATK